MSDRFLVKCNCRYNCNHHVSALHNVKINEPGACPTRVPEKRYARVLCPHCSSFQVIVLCDACYERMQRWQALNANYTCENCTRTISTHDGWTLYEDVTI